MPEVSLADVDSFGATDADADELLAACFEDHPAYLSVQNMNKFLVLGRKGAGKTAIYKKVLSNTSSTEDILAEGYNFDDYPWHHHDLQAEVGVPEERRYVHSWKYLILLSLAKLLLNQDGSQPWDESAMDPLNTLETFVVDSYGTRNPDMATLFSPEKKIKLKGSLNLKIASVQAESIPMNDLPHHVQAVNRAMQECVLESLNPGLSYYICFDQLDLGFTVTDTAYSHRLIGLLMAARDLFIAARGKGKRFNPIVFLRDDIYQELKFEDKNKITENYSATITWHDQAEGLTLQTLMERRFKQALDGSPVRWDEVFEEDQNTRMPGHQTKYQHICDRTFRLSGLTRLRLTMS